MAKSGPRPIVVKTTVNLPKQVLDAAKVIAAERNASISDVVRTALDLHGRLLQATKDGDKVLLEGEDKRIRELLIPLH